MTSDHDASEFIDGDYEARQALYGRTAAGGAAPLPRAPTREEVDTRVAEAHSKLAELKRAQEDLERERAALEETRRRQMEFQTGRDEMVQNLTRGLTLLEESEISARREADQMAKMLADLREALSKIQSIHEETWTKDNFQVELTRALTNLENARMEWNSARLKYPILSTPAPEGGETGRPADPSQAPLLGAYSFGDLCRIGFAFTWPLVAVVAVAIAIMLVFLLRG
jgi:hypothetical protein